MPNRCQANVPKTEHLALATPGVVEAQVNGIFWWFGPLAVKPHPNLIYLIMLYMFNIFFKKGLKMDVFLQGEWGDVVGWGLLWYYFIAKRPKLMLQ